MSRTKSTAHAPETTPVDDIRRVRERLSAEFGNDVDRLAEHARKVAEEYRSKLGLKRVPPPSETR